MNRKHQDADRPLVSFLVADKEDAGQRLDNFLVRQLKGVPRTRIYRLIRKGEVRVNKKRAKPSLRLVAEDSVRIPPLRQSPAKPLASSPNSRVTWRKSVIFENNDFMVINKPSNLAVHGGSGVSHGLIEQMRQCYPEYPRLELVHRLDKGTSGCLILAKRPSVLRALHASLREGRVRKRYCLLVAGVWPEAIRRVDSPLLKQQLQSGERMVKVDPRGKPARTDFRILRRFSDATLVCADLLTGRTHQIRVHAAAVGCPILGDTKYGNALLNRQFKQNYGLSRLFLHAESLRLRWDATLTEPTQAQESIVITAELDHNLESVLSVLRKGER